jgi:ABC-2 type transport system permease protein
MRAPIRSELIKLRTIAQPAVLLAVAIGLSAAMAALRASSAGGRGHLAVPPLDTAPGFTALVAGTPMALLLAAVLGITIVTGEVRHGTLTATYLITPRRQRVLVAKATTAAAVGWIFGALATGVTAGVGVGFLAEQGAPVPITAGEIGRHAAGAALASSLLAVAGVAIGSLVRSQVSAIVGLFVWAFLVETLLGGIIDAVAPWLPYTAAASLAGIPPGPGIEALPIAGATGIVAATVLALLTLASQTTIRADIT